MQYVIVGLGNPGEDYEGTRHNAGRIILDYLLKKWGFSDWKEDKKRNALVSKGDLGKHTALLLKPETFMNKSGVSVKAVVKDKKAAERLIVVYDDIDLPFGTFKISFGRGSGGHRGLDSIIKAIKTKDFVRIRVGICPATPSGKLKKPAGEEKVLDFLMDTFSKKEKENLSKLKKKVGEAIEMIVEEGRAKATSIFNSY